jgi:hypothetical protein
VHEDRAVDFFSTTDDSTDLLELVDAYSVAEVLDLLNVGLERLKSIQKSVFVFRLGDSPFFEWVIVPKVDHFISRPELIGSEPPNERLLFAVKSLVEAGGSLPLLVRVSRVFRLVADSFSDVPTVWLFHVAQGIRYKNNATLCGFLGTLRAIGGRTFPAGRSGLFVRQLADDAESTASEMSRQLSSELQDEQDYLQHALAESRKGAPEGDEEESGAGNEEEDEEEEEYNESEGDRPKRTPRQKKAKKKVMVSEPEKTQEEIKAEAANKRAQEENEKRELLERVAALQKEAVEEGRRKSAASPSRGRGRPTQSPSPRLSRKQRMERRLAKMAMPKPQEEEEEDEEEEDRELKIRRKQKKRKLSAYERQDRRFTRLRLLVARALKLAKDPASSPDALSSINDDVLAAVQQCKESRDEMHEDVRELRQRLRAKRRERDQNTRDVDDFRTEYQLLHRRTDGAKTAMDARWRAQARVKSEPSEYEEAERYLKKKIKQVKADIDRLKWQPVGDTDL